MSRRGSAEDTLDFIDEWVERLGWALMHVGGDVVSWTYTVGLLAGYDHPELIIMGLIPRAAAGFLNAIGEEIAAGRRFYPDGEIHEFNGVPVRFGRVDPEHWETARFAMWETYYDDRGGRPPVPLAIQVLWDDDDGHFPGDPAYDPRCEILQPLLAVPPSKFPEDMPWGT